MPKTASCEFSMCLERLRCLVQTNTGTPTIDEVQLAWPRRLYNGNMGKLAKTLCLRKNVVVKYVKPDLHSEAAYSAEVIFTILKDHGGYDGCRARHAHSKKHRDARTAKQVAHSITPDTMAWAQCPVQIETMTHPTTCFPCGHTFERAVVETLLQRPGVPARCPLCRAAIRATAPNRALANALAWLQTLPRHVKEQL